MNPKDIPTNLPAHPQEDRLRVAERKLAATIKDLSGQAVSAMQRHDRTQAAVLLTQLAATADAGRKAMVKAIQDQMDQVRPSA